MTMKQVVKTDSISALVLVLSIAAGAHAGDVVIDAGRGPLTVHVPTSYQPDTPAPLVLSLHRYNGDAVSQEVRMPLLPLVEEYGLLYVLPEGTLDCAGNRFWNATDACCDFEGSGVDDSGYLLALVDEIKAQLSVDDRRVYVVGHSNGGFMSYRMACDHSGIVAAIASLAGATYLEPSLCSPSEPVHVLQIHGTADPVVPYGGDCVTFDGFCFPPGLRPERSAPCEFHFAPVVTCPRSALWAPTSTREGVIHTPQRASWSQSLYPREAGQRPSGRRRWSPWHRPPPRVPSRAGTGAGRSNVPGLLE
jgi:predicted esterase